MPLGFGFAGSCQRLALLRECPPACGLPLDFASQSKSLAGSLLAWFGGSPFIGLLYGWGGFCQLKVLLASVGYAQAAITFIVSTSLPLTSLHCAHRAPPSNQRGWMHAEWAISRMACISALGMHPSAARDQLRVAKQTNPATAPICSQRRAKQGEAHQPSQEGEKTIRPLIYESNPLWWTPGTCASTVIGKFPPCGG